MTTALTLALALAVGADDFSGLGEGKPVMPAPFDKLKKGSDESTVLRTLKTRDDKICFVIALQVGKWCFVSWWNDSGGLSYVSLLFSSLPDARAALKKAWGAPQIDRDFWSWVNPTARPPLRARLRGTTDPAQLDFEEYLPVQAFLGDGPALAFETTPILGSNKAAIKKGYASRQQVWEENSVGIFFPPAETGSELLVQVELEKGLVTKFSFDLEANGDLERREQFLSMLEKKWGKRQLDEGEKNQWHFAGRKDVLVYFLAGDLTVRVDTVKGHGDR